MKLKGKTFPFWAWSPKKRDRYEIFRFVRKKPPWDEYVYDYRLDVHTYYSLPPSAYGGKSRYEGKFAKSTVGGFRDITSLPITGKKILLDNIFTPKEN